jgi:DNA-directed RNA polymerase subunit H (RpoH/RPB5)
VELEYIPPVMPTFLNYMKQSQQIPAKLPKCTVNIIQHIINIRGFTEVLKRIQSTYNDISLELYKNSEDKQCLVVISKVLKFGISHARYITEIFKDSENIIQVILIIQLDITPLARKTIKSPHIHMFHVNQLEFPFYEHKMISEHVLCSDDDIAKLRMFAKPSQLPILSTNDPICRLHGWPVGSIIKCTPNLSSTSAINIRYRVVG